MELARAQALAGAGGAGAGGDGGAAGVVAGAPLRPPCLGVVSARPDYRQRVEYRMSEWIAGHLPQARTFVAGSVRFWWDTWHDLAQVGGGSGAGTPESQGVPRTGRF